jgi:outer membrane receptor protein involved in Fe transport
VALLTLGPVLIANHAQAQESAPAPQAAQQQNLETIEVTGSRILNTDAASANPITVIGQQQIQQQKSDTVEDLLMKVPSVDDNNGLTAGSNNGGSGASEFGLRNLGPQRTLVLVNGERYPFTDLGGSSDAVDFNNIPVSMIDRLEILRDGASSIYGADAIGGVINIITKQHFQGVEVGGDVGASPRGDDLHYGVYSTVGTDFENGNILINVEDTHEAPVIGSDRYWAVNQYNTADINYYDGISSRVTGAVGQISLNNGTTTNYYFPNGLNSAILATNAYLLGNVQHGFGITSGGGLTPGDVAIPGVGVYFDYLPTEGLIRGLDSRQINLTANYDLVPGITATFEGFYTDRNSYELLNPEPTGSNTPTPQFPNGLYISPTYINSAGATVLNPYNPTNNAGFVAATGAVPASIVPILTRRFENGPRVYTDDVNTYRLRAALQGSVFGDYN